MIFEVGDGQFLCHLLVLDTREPYFVALTCSVPRLNPIIDLMQIHAHAVQMQCTSARITVWSCSRRDCTPGCQASGSKRRMEEFFRRYRMFSDYLLQNQIGPGYTVSNIFII